MFVAAVMKQNYRRREYRDEYKPDLKRNTAESNVSLLCDEAEFIAGSINNAHMLSNILWRLCSCLSRGRQAAEASLCFKTHQAQDSSLQRRTETSSVCSPPPGRDTSDDFLQHFPNKLDLIKLQLRFNVEMWLLISGLFVLFLTSNTFIIKAAMLKCVFLGESDSDLHQDCFICRRTHIRSKSFLLLARCSRILPQLSFLFSEDD